MANEWYQKYTKDVASALTRAKSAEKDAALPCTLVKMGDGSFLLCTHVAAAKAAALVKEARSHGGKVVSVGSLYKGDEGLTFAVTEGGTAVKKQFSEAAAEATGKPLAVHVVAVADAAAAPAAAQAAPAADASASFKARAVRLAAALKAAPAAVQATLQPPLVQALALGKEGRYADAEPLLKRVEDGLAAAPPAGAPPPAAAPAVAPVSSEKARFTERLKEVRPRYTEVIAADPPNRAVLEKAMGLAVQAAKDGDFARGRKALDALAAALEKAAAAAKPAGGPPLKDTLAVWETALSTARVALAKLQGKLRQTGDADLGVIADEGIGELLKKLSGGLEPALKAADKDGADAGGPALVLLAKHRQFLEGDKLVAELDANPFGEAPAVRETLIRAVGAVGKALGGS